ncbi:MAG: autotransporter outer membrane beta-barrel domain-containing protein [Terriglobales bacterium]
MRKYPGVLAGVAALCVMTWAQAPTQAPTPAPTTNQAPAQAPAPEPAPIPTPTANPVPAPQYPRFEFFGGGSYAEAGLFNAGHWAGLEGWDASLGANATSWLGFVVEGGQYFGTSKIPSAVPAPFPPGQFYEPTPSPTFNVATREYNFLFGAQFARRKYERWTPFGELMYGHQGTRGVATPQSGPLVTEVGTGRALVAGVGADYKINPRFALRFKADYLQTGTAFPLVGKQKQDNFRFSMGIVIRKVHKKKRRLEDETQPEP